MTGRHPPPVGGRTLVDGLRDDLEQCETLVSKIGGKAQRVSLDESVGGTLDSPATDGLALLRLLDHVADEFDRLDERGVDLRAERVRFENVLNQLRRREKAFVAQVGVDMSARRPEDARWWWYLDEQVAAARQRLLKRLLVYALAGLGVIAALYLAYDRFLAAPPNVRQAISGIYEGEQAVVEGDMPRAIERFEAAAALDPENVDAHLWLGVLYQATEQPDKAEAAFEQARTLIDNETEFLLQRGLFYLTLNQLDAANEDALAAIELNPDQPEGFFLLGSVAEQAGELDLARISFEKASELAEATGNVTMQATARIRLATVLQQLMAAPQE